MVSNNNKHPLLLSADESARLCGIGRSHWFSLHSAGKVPLPVKLGRRTLWRKNELEEWIEKNCPPRQKWLAMRGMKP